MSENHDQIKSLKNRISKIGVNTALTPTDKLVAVVVAATGEMNPAALIEMIGLPKSTLYRSLGNAWEYASGELENSAIPMSGNVETLETDGKQTENPSHQWENEAGTSLALNKELPKGNTLYESVRGCGGNEEIPGLNGSTGQFVTQLACTLAGALGSPDFLTAKEIIQANVDSFGADKVKVGLAEWRIKAMTDKQFRATPSSFGKFVQNARVESIERQQAKSDHEREWAEYMEKMRSGEGEFVQ